jgi:hypothetical protein
VVGGGGNFVTAGTKGRILPFRLKTPEQAVTQRATSIAANPTPEAATPAHLDDPNARHRVHYTHMGKKRAGWYLGSQHNDDNGETAMIIHHDDNTVGNITPSQIDKIESTPIHEDVNVGTAIHFRDGAGSIAWGRVSGFTKLKEQWYYKIDKRDAVQYVLPESVVKIVQSARQLIEMTDAIPKQPKTGPLEPNEHVIYRHADGSKHLVKVLHKSGPSGFYKVRGLEGRMKGQEFETHGTSRLDRLGAHGIEEDWKLRKPK